MKITALLENTTTNPSILTEHGLSLFIETNSNKILFDMGQTDLFSKNAETLGIDLSETDIAILSHGHYDHGGGLKKFLEVNDHAPVYIHKDAFLPHYNGTEKYIGLDISFANHPRIIFTEDYLRINNSLSLYSCNNKKKRFNLGSFGLTEKRNKGFIPDDFRHEQYLLIEENGKSVLISGCSHKGILDIVQWFMPDILIGGFHFSKLPLDEKLKNMSQILASYPTEYHTCHCTGDEQFNYMKNYISKLKYLSCGQSITI